MIDPLGALPDAAGGLELATFALVGLLGGAHCLGMCGPLVTTYADRMDGRENALSFYEVRQHALFNLGRTASYAVVGGVLGLLGGVAFDAAATFAVGDAVRGATGLLVGLGIAAAGFGYLARGSAAFPHVPGAVSGRVVSAVSHRIDAWVAGPRIALLGALHGALPCPILYPAFLYAFARGDPLAGALALGVLGLGTFPTLFLLGTAVGSVSPRARGRLHRVLGVAFLLLATLPLSMGLAALGVDVPGPSVPYYRPFG